MSKRWIPNMLTVFNLFAGIMAILLAFMEDWFVAAGLILCAALFDSLDGRIARRLNVASEFGKQLDSLADLVSFGMAPSIIAYLLNFTNVGWSGYLLAALFPICGALRLARFNTVSFVGHYLGLPITAAGPILAGTALVGGNFPFELNALVLVTLSALMVSTIKLPKL